MKTAAFTLVGPLVFLVLYLAVVRPHEASARAARARVDAARAELDRVEEQAGRHFKSGRLHLEPLKGPEPARTLSQVRDDLAAAVRANVPSGSGSKVNTAPGTPVTPGSPPATESILVVSFDASMEDLDAAVGAIGRVPGVMALQTIDTRWRGAAHHVQISLLASHLPEAVAPKPAPVPPMTATQPTTSPSQE